jgi:hypothetical protein
MIGASQLHIIGLKLFFHASFLCETDYHSLEQKAMEVQYTWPFTLKPLENCHLSKYTLYSKISCSRNSYEDKWKSGRTAALIFNSAIDGMSG